MATFDDLNVVQIEGVLLRPAEVKHTANGKTVARFTLMSSRSYLKNADRLVAVTYVDLEAWGALAEILEENGTAATRVRVTGALSTDTYHTSSRGGRLTVLANRIVFPHGEPPSHHPPCPQTLSKPTASETHGKILSREKAARSLHDIITTLAASKPSRRSDRSRQ